MKKLVVTPLILLSCSLVFAQKKSAPPPTQKTAAPETQKAAAPAQNERPTTEQVLKLLDLMQIRDNLQLSFDSMKMQMKGEAEAMFRERVPVPNVQELTAINNIVDEAFADVSMDDLIRDVVPVYQRHLNRSDVAALITFYSSPVGQKLRREQRAMMRETMAATSPGQQQKMESLLQKVQSRIQQLIDANQMK